MEGQTIYTGGCGTGWGGTLLGAGFGGFLGSILGNGGLLGNRGGSDAGAAATVAAVNSGADSISRQVLAGQQEQQLMGSIGGVNSRIDALTDKDGKFNVRKYFLTK